MFHIRHRAFVAARQGTALLVGASGSWSALCHHTCRAWGGGRGPQLQSVLLPWLGAPSHDCIMRMQVPEVPGELKEWAENTTLGMFAGMLYCGGRQYLANRREGKTFAVLPLRLSCLCLCVPDATTHDLVHACRVSRVCCSGPPHKLPSTKEAAGSEQCLCMQGATHRRRPACQGRRWRG